MNAIGIVVSQAIHPVFNGCLNNKNHLTMRNSEITFQRLKTKNLKQILHASSNDDILKEEDSSSDMDPSLVAESMLIGITALVILPKMVNLFHNFKKENTLQKKEMKTNTDHFFKKFFKDVMESVSVESNYSVGDEIKIGTLEGTIVKIGLMNTMLVNKEKKLIFVPNSSFFTQIVENRSRGECRAVKHVFRFGLTDRKKIHSIVKDIEMMMTNDMFVYLGAEIPYCNLYEAEKHFEIHMGFDLIRMGEQQLQYAKWDILSRATKILEKENAIFL